MHQGVLCNALCYSGLAGTAYFTWISCTGSFGSITRFTGQDCALATLKGREARMSATEAPKCAV